MTVILVDGIWGRGAVFKSLCARLEAQGFPCLVPALQPSNAIHGVAALAHQLNAFIDERVSAGAPLAIVGFSLGCIVSRYYLQHLGGHRRTRAFFALSGPHRGTWTAYGYIGQGARDLRPGSSLLRGLDATRSCLDGLALYAYWTPCDLMILPARSAHWPDAMNRKIWTPLHRLMPTNRHLQNDILQHLHCIRSAMTTESGRPL